MCFHHQCTFLFITQWSILYFFQHLIWWDTTYQKFRVYPALYYFCLLPHLGLKQAPLQKPVQTHVGSFQEQLPQNMHGSHGSPSSGWTQWVIVPRKDAVRGLVQEKRTAEFEVCRKCVCGLYGQCFNRIAPSCSASMQLGGYFNS